MADDKDQANADVQDEPTLQAVELEDLPLTEEEQVAIAAAGARPARRSATVEAKGRPTRKQSATGAETHRKRTTPAQFVRESIEELKKVIWPTLSQWQQYFIVVLVFVLFIIAIVSVLDLLFGWALLQFFG
ncbi:MAG: preprotein translocase subunit SecE [Propionicimonas sp.]|nr:preprotein translocase subunit SecE [Propionicimonas sp.]